MTTTTSLYRRIDIYNKASFKINLTLDAQSVDMTFVWNNKTKHYHATLVKTNGDVVFEGVSVNSFTAFPLNSSMLTKGFYGQFVLYPLDTTLIETESTMKNWQDYYFLVYSIIF